jgi:predicted DNA-binding transcriptional regulator AlpA
MPKPRIEYTYKYLTSPQVCLKLCIGRAQLDERLKRGIFPQPTMVAESGVRYFDDNWIKATQEIIENAPFKKLKGNAGL